VSRSCERIAVGRELLRKQKSEPWSLRHRHVKLGRNHGPDSPFARLCDKKEKTNLPMAGKEYGREGAPGCDRVKHDRGVGWKNAGKKNRATRKG